MLGFQNFLFEVALSLRLHLRSNQYIARMEKPDLTIVILVEVAVDLEDFDPVKLLDVVAHLEHLPEAEVFWTQDLEFLFY